MRIATCLGDIQAENDPLLHKAFVETEQYKQSEDPYYVIVAGKKGSGKSAIANYLKPRVETKGELTELVTPTDFSFIGLDNVESMGLNYPGFPFDDLFERVWEFTLLTTAMKIVMEKPNIWRNVSPKDRQSIQDYLVKHGLAKRNARAKFLDVCKEILSSIKVKSQGFEYTVNAWDAIRAAVNGTSYESASTALTNLLRKGITINILVDDVDRQWHTARSPDAVMRFMRGLVSTIFNMGVSAYSRKEYSDNLHLRAFVPKEALVSMPFPNMDKLRPHILEVSWDRPKLFRMICKRIGIATGHRGVSDNKYLWQRLFPERLKLEPRLHCFDSLLRYTSRRPREVIALCQQCIIQAAIRGRVSLKASKVIGNVTDEDIYAAIKAHTPSAAEDVVKEEVIFFPRLNEVLNLFATWPWVLTYRDVDDIIKEGIERLKLREDSDAIIQKLFNIGFLGGVVRRTTELKERATYEIVYYYDDRSVALHRAKNVVIHPVFHRKYSSEPAPDPTLP